MLYTVAALAAFSATVVLASPLTSSSFGTPAPAELNPLLNALPIDTLPSASAPPNRTALASHTASAAAAASTLVLCPVFNCSNDPPCYLFELDALPSGECFSTHLFDSVGIIQPSDAAFGRRVEVALGGCQDNVAVIPQSNVCFNLDDIAPLDAFEIF